MKILKPAPSFARRHHFMGQSQQHKQHKQRQQRKGLEHRPVRGQSVAKLTARFGGTINPKRKGFGLGASAQTFSAQVSKEKDRVVE